MLPDRKTRPRRDAADATPLKASPLGRERRPGGVRKGRTACPGAAGILALALALVQCAEPADAADAARCVAFGAAPVIVTGTLGAAPLGEGSEEPGAASLPLRYQLRLLLDAPLCAGDAATGSEGAALAGATELSVVYGDRYRFRHVWLGRHVSVTGTMIAPPGDSRTPPPALEARETHILALRTTAARDRPNDRAPPVDTAAR